MVGNLALRVRGCGFRAEGSLQIEAAANSASSVPKPPQNLKL